MLATNNLQFRGNHIPNSQSLSPLRQTQPLNSPRRCHRNTLNTAAKAQEKQAQLFATTTGCSHRHSQLLNNSDTQHQNPASARNLPCSPNHYFIKPKAKGAENLSNFRESQAKRWIQNECSSCFPSAARPLSLPFPRNTPNLPNAAILPNISVFQPPRTRTQQLFSKRAKFGRTFSQPVT